MQIRSQWIWVPVTCLFVAWLVHTAQPACRFDDVIEALEVRDAAEYRKLAVLGLALVGVVAVLRVLRGRGKDE